MTADIVVTGVIGGLGYALLAIGLLLVYRVARVLNFGYAQVGAFAAAVVAKLVLDEHVPYWAGVVIGVLVGALVSFAFERIVLRQLAGRPTVVLLVATLGLSQIAVAASNLLPDIRHAGPYPSALSGRFHALGVTVTGADVTMLVALLAIGGGLTLFLARSHYGTALLACSDNPDAARLAGIPVRRMTSVVFAASGALAAITVILYTPVQGLSAGTDQSGQGTAILLMAFTAALAGGFWSLPRAAVAGVVLGVVEALLYANTSSPGQVNALLFVVLVLVVVATARHSRLAVDSASIAPATRPVPRALTLSRWSPTITAGGSMVALAAALILPLLLGSSSAALTLIEIICYALAALSVCVVTGWTGQITLGQFAFVGIGAFLTARLMNDGWNMFAALAVTTVAGAALAAALGVPALRARGMFLAVLTLGFAVAVQAWLLPSALLNPTRQTLVSATAPIIAGYDLSDPRNFYYFCLAVLVVVLIALAGVARTGAGRQLRAVRDNETAAGALGVNAAAAKIKAFTLGGAIAALAGGLYGVSLGVFQAGEFSADASVSIVFMVVLGGIATLAGPVIASIAIIGVPVVLGVWVTSLSDNVQNVTTLLGAVGVMLALRKDPEGIGAGLRRARERLLRRLVPGAGAVSTASREYGPDSVDLRTVARLTSTATDRHHSALKVEDVSVRFGGVVANDHVSFTLDSTSVVGLIGANGAGKSTLVNAISGVQPCSGAITLGGRDLSRLPAYRRARAGIARTFQDARLYAGLTVSETLSLAMDTGRSRSMLASMVWLPTVHRADREVRRKSDALAIAYGLGAWVDSLVSDLSTGTRRMLEIACIAARDPLVVLLDEPAAGVAQREVEQLGEVLLRLRDRTGAAFLLIEHDLPFVMSISERIIALGHGTVIANGTPQEVRNDPVVITSYLGIDERAVARSSTLPASA